MVGGRYRLTAPIATGGMGQVWRAVDTVLDRPVAVKLVRDDADDGHGWIAEQPFEVEARLAASVAHRGVATVFDFGTDRTDGHVVEYLVMELVEGEPLADVLHREPVPPQAFTMSVIAQLADALGAAHRAGVVHRDVKPANVIVVSRRLDDPQVKLTDFGVARPVTADSAGASAYTLGTPRYMSPEQLAGRPTSPASDVYALGVLAVEMLTGRVPFPGDTASAVVAARAAGAALVLPERIPSDLRGLLVSSLATDPAERPPDGDAFARRLADARRARPAHDHTLLLPAAPPAAPVDHAARRWWWFALPLMLLIAAGVIAVARSGAGDSDTPDAPTSVPAVATTVPPPTAIATTAPAFGRPPAPTSVAEAPGSVGEPAAPGGKSKDGKGNGNGKGRGG